MCGTIRTTNVWDNTYNQCVGQYVQPQYKEDVCNNTVLSEDEIM